MIQMGCAMTFIQHQWPTQGYPSPSFTTLTSSSNSSIISFLIAYMNTVMIQSMVYLAFVNSHSYINITGASIVIIGLIEIIHPLPPQTLWHQLHARVEWWYRMRFFDIVSFVTFYISGGIVVELRIMMIIRNAKIIENNLEILKFMEFNIYLFLHSQRILI